MARTGQSQSQELHVGLPLGCRDLSSWSIREQGTGLEIEKRQYKPAPRLDTHIAGNGLTNCTTTLAPLCWVSQQPDHIGYQGKRDSYPALQHILRAIKTKLSPLNHNRPTDLTLFSLSWVNRTAKSQILKHLIQATNRTKESLLFTSFLFCLTGKKKYKSHKGVIGFNLQGR